MRRVLLGMFVALLTVSNLLFAGEKQALKMKIEGMKCGLCEAKVKKQLSFLCQEIKIDREKGEGLCTYEAPVTPDQILSEANKTGFHTSKTN